MADKGEPPKRGPKGFALKKTDAAKRNTTLTVKKEAPSVFAAEHQPFAGEKLPLAVRGAKPAAVAAPKPAAVAAPKPAAVAAPKSAAVAAPKPAAVAAPKPAAVAAPKPAPVLPAPPALPAPEAAPVAAPVVPKPNNRTKKQKVLNLLAKKKTETAAKAVAPELKKQVLTLKQRQQSEEEADVYETESVPYIPESRTAFRRFLINTYSGFILPPILSKEPNPNACSQLTLATYKYQAFVREYMRSASPYRGVLVYHGLGSGKTCTSIAASEALFSQGKKIIVMTPIALMENFLNEIMFCGFRHFRLTNHWVKFPLDTKTSVIARSVLELPEPYLKRIMRLKQKERRVFWMPDLEKPEAEANYETLQDWERASIRAQLYEILKSRIMLVGYTGMTRKALLKLILEKDAFDDAVIVIDEVHNLTRLMRGKLDKYLKEAPPVAAGRGGKPKKVSTSYEPVTVDKWEPKLLPKDADDYVPPYERAFLFYRLLVQARRSKIIALSGTPIVNFPEELGILANLLHGYNECVRFKCDVKEGTVAAQKAVFEEICRKHPQIDFYSVETDPQQTKLEVFYSVLPEGYTKVFGEDGIMEGVVQQESEELFLAEREGPENETNVYIRNIQDSVIAEVSAKGYTVQSTEYQARSQFPPTVEEFRNTFLQEAYLGGRPVEAGAGAGAGAGAQPVAPSEILKNPYTFMKRMSGLVSYYKGGNENLMPRVSSDTNVLCPISAYQMPIYAKARALERQQDETAGKKTSWQEANELAGSDIKSTSYRFRSRSICNFAFPAYIPRPFPVKSKDFKAAAAVDDLMVSDAVVEDTTEEVRELLADTEEPEAGEAVEAAINTEKAEKEAEEAADSEDEEDDADAIANVEAEEAALESEYEASVASGNSLGTEAELARREELKAKILDPTVPYLERVQIAFGELFKAKETLFKLTDDQATKNASQRLETYSPKFREIYDRILASKGSSLVYSQFKTLEGTGILGLVLQANGFVRIRLEGSENDLRLSDESVASIRDHPEQPRYIEYSGGDSKRVRQVLIDLFNMRVDKLPAKIAPLLRETPLAATRNQKGEVCRVFMITGAGAEGLSLKNVRTVHIMEPYWNKVRTDQVKGRAVRICSHADLPWEERTVEIFTYLATLDERVGKIDETLRLQDEGKTSDEHIYNVSRSKEDISNAFLTAIKQSAVDCELNSSENEPIACFKQEFKSIEEFSIDPRLEKDLLNETSKKRTFAAPPLQPSALPAVTTTKAPTEKPTKQVITYKGTKYILESYTDGRRLLYSYTREANLKTYEEGKAKPIGEIKDKKIVLY